MLSRFWSDSYWLPANITWEDISNGPGKDKVFAEVQDYWAQIPLVIVSLTLRFLSEKYVFVPLGRYLNVRAIKVKRAPPNGKLEAEYQKSSKCKNASTLAKHFDITERQIERWWRLRRSQDKPTTLVKFCENMWKGCYFSINISLGIYVVWGEDWVQDLDKCFDGYPLQGITPEIWWFYMLASAFYITLIITQFRDVRRKDFWHLFVHHIATFCLLFFSWALQCFRIGCIILILHDAADVVLEFGKAAKYAQFQRTVHCLFGVFVCVWVVTRLVLYPIYVLPIVSKYGYLSKSATIMYILLMILLVLSLFWTWLIFKVVIRSFSTGKISQIRVTADAELVRHLTGLKVSVLFQVCKDLRSSESEDSDQTSSPASKEVS